MSTFPCKVLIRDVPEIRLVAGQVDALGLLACVVALDAVFVQYRLYDRGIVKFPPAPFGDFKFLWRLQGREGVLGSVTWSREVAIGMTADAVLSLAALEMRERTHPLYGPAFLVQGQEVDRDFRRHFEMG